MFKTTYGWTNNPRSPHIVTPRSKGVGTINEMNLEMAWRNVKCAADAFADADSDARRLECMSILATACDDCCRWLSAG